MTYTDHLVLLEYRTVEGYDGLEYSYEIRNHVEIWGGGGETS
jgi:hypothetical protein